jgi:galactose mutarotase-like enzyme
MMRFITLVARACLGISDKMEAAAAARRRYTVCEEPADGPGSPPVLLLHDYEAGMEAAVAPSRGGELTSLRVRFRHLPVELIYRARKYGSDSGFRGKAPFLWPATESHDPAASAPNITCGDGAYMPGDRTSPMPYDGFAKDLAWSEADRSSGAKGARVMVELRDSEQTRIIYPFGFSLRAAYELADGRLTVTYTVSAARGNAAPMPFSIGNRLALRIPFVDGTEPEAMRLQTYCTTQILPAEAGISSGDQCERSFATPTRLGDFDATGGLQLAGYRSAPFARLSDPQGLALRIAHRADPGLPEPLVQFHICGGPQQGFFCPAPWFGVPNCPHSATAAVMLRPGGDWQWTVELRPETALPHVFAQYDQPTIDAG